MYVHSTFIVGSPNEGHFLSAVYGVDTQASKKLIILVLTDHR